jgi:hypothetical protein
MADSAPIWVARFFLVQHTKIGTPSGNPGPNHCGQCGQDFNIWEKLAYFCVGCHSVCRTFSNGLKRNYSWQKLSYFDDY